VCLPYHTVAYFLVVARLARFQTYPLYVVWSKNTNDLRRIPSINDFFCKETIDIQGQSVEKQREWCDGDAGTEDIQSVAERFCTVVAQRMAPSMCTGFSAAHWVGICLVLSFAINMICDAAACFLLHEYINNSLKKKHRQTALILVWSGTAMVTLFLLLYGFLVILQLNETGGFGQLFAAFMGKSDSVGASIGYFFAWFAVFIEGAAMILLTFVKSKEEDAMAEAKQQREVELQMGADPMYGAHPYQGTAQGQYGQNMGAMQYQAGYSNYPQAQSSMGQGQGNFGLPPSSGGWNGQSAW